MMAVLKEFELVFSPKAVAVIGALRNQSKLGYPSLKFLIKAQYLDKNYPVNPTAENVRRYRAYPSILDVPDEIDLAVISLPSFAVLGVSAHFNLLQYPHFISIFVCN